MKKILDIIGSLKLTFVLIILIVLFLFIGGTISLFNYKVIDSMNKAQLIDWLINSGLQNFRITWWIYALMLLFTAIGINTVACSLNRIISIIKKNHSSGLRTLSILLTPSIIHLLFLLALLGHLSSSVFLNHQVYELGTSNIIPLDNDYQIEVTGVNSQLFPENSLMKKRYKQVELDLIVYNTKLNTSKKKKISFLHPLRINGRQYLLEMTKKSKLPPCCTPPTKENCNKSPLFNLNLSDDKFENKLILTSHTEPGFYIIEAAFILIIILMLWYYPQIKKIRLKQN